MMAPRGHLFIDTSFELSTIIICFIAWTVERTESITLTTHRKAHLLHETRAQNNRRLDKPCCSWKISFTLSRIVSSLAMCEWHALPFTVSHVNVMLLQLSNTLYVHA